MQTTLPFIEQDRSDESFEALLFHAGEKHISVEFSIRMKKSWRIHKRGRQYTLTAPAPFKESDLSTKKAMISWAQIMKSTGLSRKKMTPEQQIQIQELEKQLWNYLHGETEISIHRKFHTPHERFKHSFGAKFDLKVQFDSLNDKYFDSELTSFLRWGQHGSKTSYHTIIVDENNDEHHLITIAGLYNYPSIPEYALNGVLYHEMCHIACPPRQGQQRRNVHHTEFRKREREYEQFDKWQNWLQKDAQKLIRRMRRFS